MCMSLNEAASESGIDCLCCLLLKLVAERVCLLKIRSDCPQEGVRSFLFYRRTSLLEYRANWHGKSQLRITVHVQ